MKTTELVKQILEILDKHTHFNSYNYVQTMLLDKESVAFEIASLIEQKHDCYEKEFVKWLIIDQEIFMGELSEQFIINDNFYVNGLKLKTLDEFFNYWKNKIKDKEQ